MSDVLRRLTRRLEERRREAMRRIPSLVRRIERVAPVPGRRLVAITFDDGPSAAPVRPWSGEGPAPGLTEHLLRVLARYRARGTFNVIGDTGDNYPDREGRLHTPRWSGVKHDHYPEFGLDHLAGVANQPELVRRLAAEGHELANHTYAHVAFGPTRWVCGSRAHQPSLEAVVADLRRLHELVLQLTGGAMALARPPYFIDRTRDGFDAYDAFARLGYQYLAASFDGGGCRPTSGSYARDVEAAVAPLERALADDPEALNGQIIAQKDGYNMSKQSLVADALPRQLEILRRHGYEVITVSELLRLSPVHDTPPDHPNHAALCGLLRAGHMAAFRDNSAQPDRPVTRLELALMALPADIGLAAPARPSFPDIPPCFRHLRAVETALALGLVSSLPGEPFRPDDPATSADVIRAAVALARYRGRTVDAARVELPKTATVPRGRAMELLWQVIRP